MSEKEKILPQQIVYVQQPIADSDDEQEVDIGRIAELFWENRGFAAKCSLGLAAVFLGVSFFLPKTYESTTVVQTSASSSSKNSSAALMTSLGGGSGNKDVDNYIALMKSRAVIEPIVADMEFSDTMFHTAEENKERAIAGSAFWAEDNLKIENAKGTNLISITAQAKSPEKAQEISQAVVDNFLQLQTELNQKQQSLLVKFLDERIKQAYEEATEAGKKFSTYQKDHNVYDPTEQAKTAISRMDAYTNTLADLKSKQEATKAELAVSSQQLSNLNEGSLNYKINDNSTVQDMRQQIANREVALVSLRSKYTEDHPDIVRAKAELSKMQSNLSREVNAIVASKTAAMSPQQSALISKKLNAEVNLKVTEVSEQAIQAKFDEEQKKLDDFPEAMRNYLDLKQEFTMKQSIYTNLVSQAEAAKLKAAQDSMDIQVVDPANLPLEDMPADPKKKRNAMIGSILGLLNAGGMACYKYWLEVKAMEKA